METIFSAEKDSVMKKIRFETNKPDIQKIGKKRKRKINNFVTFDICNIYYLLINANMLLCILKQTIRTIEMYAIVY